MVERRGGEGAGPWFTVAGRAFAAERTRREALGGAAALLAPAALHLRDASPALAAAQDDAGPLRRTLAIERTAVVAFRDLAGRQELSPSFAALLERIARQEREHAGALAAALRRRGGVPPPAPRPQAVPGLQGVRGRREIASFALALESRAVASHYRAVQALSDPELVRTVAQIMAGDGQHLVVLRQALGRDPIPRAFETGKPS